MLNEKLYLDYLGLGPERTLDKLSELSGKSLSALQKMSSRYNWKERLKRDTDELKRQYPTVQIESLSNSEIVACISRESLENLFRSIKTLKVTNVRDAKILLEIAQLAAGKPTEITQTKIDSEDKGYSEFLESILTDEQQNKIVDYLFREE